MAVEEQHAFLYLELVHAVLAVLDARQIEVPEATRALIAGCRDLAQLDAWVRRAATAATIDDLFA